MPVMELKRLMSSETEPYQSSSTVIDKAFQYRKRVDSIIYNLKDDIWGEKEHQIFKVTTPDALQEYRKLLIKERFDPKAQVIYEDAKEAVKFLEDKATRTSLQRFLKTYNEFRKKEEDIFSNDREALLLDLKNELERISTNNLNEYENKSSEISIITIDSVESKDGQVNSDIKVDEKSEIILAKNIETTLNSMEGLKDTYSQMSMAKTQMEGLCAFLDYRKMKKEVNKEKLLVNCLYLSEHLSNMKKSLISSKCKNGKELQSIMVEIKKGLLEATAIYERWSMHETILSSSVEHRKNTLKGLMSSLRNHEGKLLKDELGKKEARLSSHKLSLSQNYLDGMQAMIADFVNIQSDMFESAKRYQIELSDNLEPLDKVFGAFEKLENLSRNAGDNWSRKQTKMTNVALSIIDRELEIRLLEAIRRIEVERTTFANDGKVIRFLAQDDSLQRMETRSIQMKDIDNLNGNQFLDGEIELVPNIREIGILVNEFVVTTKLTFMTLNALKKLDACLAFSSSKLDVLNFDIIHRMAYLEARNKALSLFWGKTSKDIPNEKQNSSPSRITERPIKHDSYKNSKSVVQPIRRYVRKSNGDSLPSVDERPTVKIIQTHLNLKPERSRLYTQLKEPVAYDTNTIKSQIGLATHCFQEDCAINSDISAEKAEKHDKKQISIKERQFLRKQELLEQGALDMAKYFRFHKQNCNTSRYSPIKFLFYTKGIGVFTSKNGELVDALGFPFPKQRRCFWESARLASMSKKSHRLFQGKTCLRSLLQPPASLQ